MPTRAAANKAASKPAAAAKPATRAAAKPAAAAKAAPAKAAATRKAAPAAKAPAKAAPATTSRRSIKPADDDVDLLAGLSDETSTVDDSDDDSSFDLLSDLTEDGGTPWYPWDAEDQPEGIQGKVQYIGTVDREERFGGGEAPYLEIADKDDPEFIWAVRGYATVLANQLNKHIDQGLSVGDLIGIMYFGEKANRKGDNSYKNFKVVVKKAR